MHSFHRRGGGMSLGQQQLRLFINKKNRSNKLNQVLFVEINDSHALNLIT